MTSNVRAVLNYLLMKNTNKGCYQLLVGENTNKGYILVGENTNKGCARLLVDEKHQQGLCSFAC